ncbi:MAG: glycosyltransferase family 2 protein [Alistipes sp.]|nr:glycosyltransferase family 2 protein [Alistipes sp.]
MAQHPRITLVIPTYNRSSSLLRTLESVALQELDPTLWCCLIIDNGSTDDTAEVVERFAAEHPKLSLRRVVEPQAGVSHARNRALQEATTELICSIDDDERINPDFIEAYLRFFDTHPDAVVAGGRIIAEYTESRPRWQSRWSEQLIANPIDRGPDPHPFPEGKLPGGGNMGFRRSSALQVGFATELGRTGKQLLGGEENDFFLRLREAGATLWYLPEAVIWHIIPPEKCTLEYLKRLARNNGLSQMRRAVLRGENPNWMLLREGLKWVATLLLCCTMLPAKGHALFLMRREISRGILAGRATAEKE